MVILIRLYPIIAICIAWICFDFARTLNRKGKSTWLLPAFLALVALGTIAIWWIYRGDLNAEQIARDWAN